ncbi:MAG TPA: LysR family transcriptional regulator [Kofleriaceae bacterium]|jgi:DNA-binding transcriptional LysR family regulator
MVMTIMQISDEALPSLELLRCFMFLHRERHLSRAAARARISQPAMSRMLARLRETFGDPLFVRTPTGMVPTARADEVAPRVADIVSATSALVHPAAFDPAQLLRTFTLVTAGFAEGQILPILVSELAAEAPGVTLSMRPASSPVYGAEQLERGGDLLITVKEALPPNAKRMLIYEESFACALRKGHPVKRLTLDRFCELGHVLVSPGESGGSIVDSALAKLGRTRRVAVRVHTFPLAPPIIAASDLVITAPKLSLRGTDFALHAPPIELPTYGVYLAWHPRVDSDPAGKWFRAKVLAAMRRRS